MLEARLTEKASETGRTKSELVCEALVDFFRKENDDGAASCSADANGLALASPEPVVCRQAPATTIVRAFGSTVAVQWSVGDRFSSALLWLDCSSTSVTLLSPV